MPTVAPVLSLPDNLSVTPKAATAGMTDGFLALLNVVGQNNGAPGDDTGDEPPAAKDHSRQSGPLDPPAAAIDTPAPFAARQPEDRPEPAPATARDAAPRNGRAEAAPDNAQPDEMTKAAAAADDSNQNPQATDTDTDTDTAPAQDTAKPVAANDIGAQQEQLRSGIKDRLTSISQIVQAIIQALTGGPDAAPQAVQAAANIAAPAAPVTLAAATTFTVPVPQASLPPEAIATIAPISALDLPATLAALPDAMPATGLALLKDIQQMLQQLPQALGQGTATILAGPVQTPAAAPLAQNGQTDNLQVIMALLQRDISTLSQLLSPPADSAPAPVAPLAVDTLQLGDLKALLKDGISQVRDQLQQLQADNTHLFVQAKTSFQAKFAEVSALFKDTVASTAAAALKEAIPGAAAAAASINPATQNVMPAPVLVNPQTDAAVIVPAVAVSQGGTHHSGSDHSGGGNQNQSLPQPVLAASGGQSSSAGGIAGASFSRALNQASQAPVLEQVTFHIKTAVSDGSSRIRIQLDPADLGKLDIKLNVGADGKTGVVITADNRSTLELLQRDAPGLMRALADAGLTMDSGSMNFNLGGQRQDANPSPQATQTYRDAQPDMENEPAVDAVARSYVVNLAEGLDIRI